MRKLQITTGKTVRSGRVSRARTSWPLLSERLQKFRTTGVTLADYAQLGVDDKLALKNSFGFFIGGWFSDQGRRRDQLVARSVLTLDIDYLDPWDVPTIAELYASYEFVMHSTMSHTVDKPKLRLVFPLARDVTLDEYEPIARMVGSWFDINAVDKVSYRPAQLMYWPAVCSDGAPLFSHNKGAWLAPDEVLAGYEDWKDNFTWPVAEKDSTPRPTGLRAENPLNKVGIVGAFCRCYSIHDAIRTFALPYTGTEDPDRYTPAGATGSEGAVVYDDGLFLYSHHSNDAASNKNLNAWDLVRLCKFGHLDEGLDEQTPLQSLPSQKEMAAFAARDTRVTQSIVEDDFENLDANNGTEVSPVVDTVPAPLPPAAWDDSDQPPEKPRSHLDFDSLLGKIENFQPGELTPYLCKELVFDICAARTDPTDTGLLLKALQRTAKASDLILTMESLRDQLDVAGRRLTAKVANKDGSIRDIEEDLVNEVLAEHYDAGREIRRVSRKFWTYDEGLWSVLDTDEPVSGAIAQTFMRLRKERPETVRELVAAVGETKTSTLSRQLSDMFTTLLAVRDSKPDPLMLMRRFELPVVNCRNVEIAFDRAGNQTIKEHRPESFHTVRVDTVYDPRAVAPTWDAFCTMIFSGCVDPEGMTRHLEEVCGYAIQMSRWLKCWVLLHGPTNTGKTTVADVLKSLLGGAVLEKELQGFAAAGRSTFAESGLIGKLVLVDDDQAKGALLPDGFLKKISEEKPISTELKYGSTINFICRALPLMCSNHWPATRDLSDALRDRAVVFPFSRPFSATERSDAAKNRMLDQERSGILNRFLAGIGRLRARGSWDPPIDALEAAEMWVSHSNPLAQFVHDRLVLGSSTPVLKCVKSTDVWHAYVGWCAENVLDRKFRLPKRTFLDQMLALGYVRARDTKGMFRFKGVARILADED